MKRPKTKKRTGVAVKRLVRLKYPCHFSKTGWAFADKDGCCMCHACQPPRKVEQVHPDLRDRFKPNIGNERQA
jgi:hypothetical protein